MLYKLQVIGIVDSKGSVEGDSVKLSRDGIWCSTIQDLEGIEQVRCVSHASVLIGRRVVLGDVTIASGAEEYLLDVKVEAGTKTLDGVDVDTSKDGITWVVGDITALSEAHGAIRQVDRFLAHQHELGVEAVLLGNWVADLKFESKGKLIHCKI